MCVFTFVIYFHLIVYSCICKLLVLFLPTVENIQFCDYQYQEVYESWWECKYNREEIFLPEIKNLV